MNHQSSSFTIVGLLLAGLLIPQAVSGQDMPRGNDGMSRDGMMEMMGGGMMGRGMMGGDGMMGGGMMSMMGQGMGMMGIGGPPPAMLLRMGDALDLSEEQRSELEAIRDAHQTEIQPLMSEMMQANRDAQSALDGDSPDFDAYEEALGEAAERMVEAHVEMARAAAEARAVLTDEQRDRLGSGMRMMEGMMMQQSGGMGGMMRSPGNR